jgi:hypothetical protein
MYIFSTLTESQQHRQYQDGLGVSVPTLPGEPAIYRDSKDELFKWSEMTTVTKGL